MLNKQPTNLCVKAAKTYFYGNCTSGISTSKIAALHVIAQFGPPHQIVILLPAQQGQRENNV